MVIVVMTLASRPLRSFSVKRKSSFFTLVLESMKFICENCVCTSNAYLLNLYASGHVCLCKGPASLRKQRLELL